MDFQEVGGRQRRGRHRTRWEEHLNTRNRQIAMEKCDCNDDDMVILVAVMQQTEKRKTPNKMEGTSEHSQQTDCNGV
jgi:hypothetical protein